uniref:Uncharacterized protein n=1 Tax=Oryza punctata TaxID=4537 RepID=A0A0E0KWG5_ORYPU
MPTRIAQHLTRNALAFLPAGRDAVTYYVAASKRRDPSVSRILTGKKLAFVTGRWLRGGSGEPASRRCFFRHREPGAGELLLVLWAAHGPNGLRPTASINVACHSGANSWEQLISSIASLT